MGKSVRPHSKTIFVCQQCGKESLKWVGRCPSCQQWNSFIEKAVTAPATPFSLLSTANPPQELSQVVIETAIQSDTPLQLGLENAQLSTPGGDRGPVSKETLHDYWYNLLIKKYEGYGKGGGQYNNWTMKIVMETIDETVLASDAQVLAGTETVGYILFDQVRGEKKVNATLTLPVYDSQGELLHEFEFSFPI